MQHAPPIASWVESTLEVRSEMAHTRLVDVLANKKHTLHHQSGVASPGDTVRAGETIAEGSGLSGGELALGKNVVVAYLPFEGYNYEDAIVISKRCVREDIFTSVHVERIERRISVTETLSSSPDPDGPPVPYLEGGIPREGTWVDPGDVLVGLRRIIEPDSEDADEGGAWRPAEVVNSSLYVPNDVRGRVVDHHIYTEGKKAYGEDEADRRVVVVSIAMTCRVQVGDKLSGRHGNKGIVARVVDDRDMPYLPDGTPVDVCLNPLGVPSRMNVGQIFECLLGSAGRWTGQDYRVGPFDEMFAQEASRSLVFQALQRAQGRTSYSWLLDPKSPGKTRLFDGRTGRPFSQPVTAGVTYIIKLIHMVRGKIIARSSGRYNAMTMQPVRGRRNQGGQRLGEMEVSALVGYSARQTLQEMLTVKSDDLWGRNEAKQAMRNGRDVQLPLGGTPEGYRTFLRELQAGAFTVIQGTVGDEDAGGTAAEA